MPKYEVVSDHVEAFRFVNTFSVIYASSWQKGLVLKRDGKTVAAALYVEFNGTNIFVHLAGTPGRHWLTREFLYWGFDYPFRQLGCSRMTCLVSTNNVASQRFCEHVGWTREGVMARAGTEGEDVIAYRMFREDCRYVSDAVRR